MNTHKFRVVALLGIGRKLEDTLAKHAVSEEGGLMPSCISCEFFDEGGVHGFGPEICLPQRARPPARIIAFGCSHYKDKDDIPF
jgi:hypothetical protein